MAINLKDPLLKSIKENVIAFPGVSDSNINSGYGLLLFSADNTNVSCHIKDIRAKLLDNTVSGVKVSLNAYDGTNYFSIAKNIPVNAGVSYVGQTVSLINESTGLWLSNQPGEIQKLYGEVNSTGLGVTHFEIDYELFWLDQATIAGTFLVTFTTTGTTSWTVPAGTNSVDIVAVGGGGYGGLQGGGNGPGGGGGGGGALAYKNDWSVTPGDSMTIVVGAGGTSATIDGGDSTVSYASNTLVAGGGESGGDGTTNTNGGPGGQGGQPSGFRDGGGSGGSGADGGPDDGDDGNPGSGGGAGGYSGNGGDGINAPSPSSNYTAPSGQGGGGGGGGPSSGTYEWAAGGGGVGILGEGLSGAGGENIGNGVPTAGGGGSGGADGGSGSANGNNFGGAYGGGAGGGGGSGGANTGGQGAVALTYYQDSVFTNSNAPNPPTLDHNQRYIQSTIEISGGSAYTLELFESQKVSGSYNWSLSGTTTNISPTSGTVTFTNGYASINFTTSNPSASEICTFATGSNEFTSTITVLPVTALYSFTSFTFTNAGVVGRSGPSLATALASYNTTNDPWLNNTSYFNVVSGIQYWTVPETGNYLINALGAGSIVNSNWTNNNSQNGARIQDTFSLTSGEIIRILVGQQPNTTVNTANGGAGGTYVVRTPYNTNASILVIAGGGGGGESSPASNTMQYGQTTTSGGDGIAPVSTTGSGAGGTNGGGGGTATSANGGGGGGGFFTDGTRNNNWNNDGGQAFVNGGVGAVAGATTDGGFGGGGGAGGNGSGGGPGGGGGYSGGGGGDNVSASYAGGGGSYFANGLNINRITTANSNSGNGQVTITKVP